MTPVRSSLLVTNSCSPARLQEYVSAVQNVMQINLLSFNQSELCLELRPRLCSDQTSSELEALKLTVTWSHDDRFRLQVTICELVS